MSPLHFDDHSKNVQLFRGRIEDSAKEQLNSI